MRRHRLTKRRVGIGEDGPALVREVPIPADDKSWPAGLPPDKPDKGSAKHDQGKGHTKDEYRDERCRGERDHDLVFERPPPNPNHRLEHHRQHGGLKPEEEPHDDADLPVERVNEAESHYGDEPGQDEQRAGDETASGLMEKPTDVDGELLSLGTGQQHAVVEGMQKSILANPALLVDEDAMHHRDLPRRA